MDAAPTSPLSREAREDMSVHEGQSQQDEDEDAALDALFSPTEQQVSEADGQDPVSHGSDEPRTRTSSRGKRKEVTRDEDAAADAVDTTRCRARTWKRAFLPRLPQCMRKPLANSAFCSVYAQSQPYGRCDNPLDPSVEAKVSRFMKRYRI